ncbi:MAG: hypothetical protein AAFY63_11825 [Cyanobacteria bacterium J06643_13]
MIKPLIKEVFEKSRLETLTLGNLQTGDVETVQTHTLFIFIDAKPNTQWLQKIIKCDRPWRKLNGQGSAHAEWRPLTFGNLCPRQINGRRCPRQIP